MNNLRLIPDTHRPQEIIKAFLLLENTTNEVFDSSRNLLFIRARKVTPHMLRHGFATHRLEQGISLRHIQTLLGQSSSQTTAIYTQVATQEIGKIKNPLDNFYTSESSTIPTN